MLTIPRYLAAGMIAVAVLTVVVAASCSSTPAQVTPSPTQATMVTPPRPTVTAPLPSPTATPTPAAKQTASTIASFAGQPLVSFLSAHFTGSGDCALCHSQLVDRAGNDVSIDAHWRSTMMANSANDPLWQAKVSSEVARAPLLEAEIEDKCATCHMPMARTEAAASGEPASIFNDGLHSAEHPLHAFAMDGVSCSLCHQIQDVSLGEKESFEGHYTIDVRATPPDRAIYGPFPRPYANPMRMNVGFTPIEGPHTLDSGLCGTCHTLYTPYVDAGGNVLGTFPEQMPYLEWEQSAYGGENGRGRSCQQCHMPAAESAAVISNRPPGGPLAARSPFARHFFVGGNTFMLDLFRVHGEQLGLTAGTAHLEATLARTVERLSTTTAALSIVSARTDGNTVTVILETASAAGHKFPTGFPSRRAWLHVTLHDAAGRIVFESGQPQADGSIAGNDADQDAARYEPHYDRISSPDQVQIYEPIMRNSDGQITYTLLRAASYAKDNRLLPFGFDKTMASEDVRVRGAAAEDETFVGGSDQIGYQVDVGEHKGPFTVRAELLYQSLSYQFAQDLCSQDLPQSKTICDHYRATDHIPALVASVERRIR